MHKKTQVYFVSNLKLSLQPLALIKLMPRMLDVGLLNWSFFLCLFVIKVAKYSVLPFVKRAHL